jgi:hypothetical protein
VPCLLLSRQEESVAVTFLARGNNKILRFASLLVWSPYSCVSELEGPEVSGRLCSLLVVFVLGFEVYVQRDGRLFTSLCSILRNSTQACINTVNAEDAEVTMLDGNHMFEEVGSGRVSTLTIFI